MNTQRWYLVGLVTVLIVVLLVGENVQAQSQPKYPTRAIDIIAPFGAGGGTDLLTRIIAAHAKKKWGVPVNVVNKPGGNGVPACLELYNSKPDGYTLISELTSISSTLPIVVKDLPFKIMDRTFIASLSMFNLILMVNAKSPIKSLEELFEAIKKDPQSITWNTFGGASQYDIGARQIFKLLGVDILKTRPVTAKSGSESMKLLAGGHLVMGNCSPGPAIPLIKGGLVRALAITSPVRIQLLPGIPTTAELGFPTLNASNWNGISGPPNLPPHIVEMWDKALGEMAKDPEVISEIAKTGSVPFYLSKNELREFVVKETQEMAELWSTPAGR